MHTLKISGVHICCLFLPANMQSNINWKSMLKKWQLLIWSKGQLLQKANAQHILKLKTYPGFLKPCGRRPCTLQMGLPFISQENWNLKSNMTTNIVTKVREVSVNSEQVHLILSKYWGTNFHFCSVHYFSYFC